MSIKGRSRVDQVSIKGVDQHLTTAALSAHYPEKCNPKLITYTYVARHTGNWVLLHINNMNFYLIFFLKAVRLNVSTSLFLVAVLNASFSLSHSAE